MENNNSIFCTGKEITPFSRCNVHVGKNIGLGICACDEITPKNLARFCTSIKYLIVLFSINYVFHDNVISKIIKSRKGYFPRSYGPRGNNPFLDLIILDITLS